MSEHGTARKYKLGCRCDVCRAKSAHTRRLHRAGLGPGKTPAGQQVHSLHGYLFHKCRCAICTAANTAMMARYRARKRAAA